MTSLINRIELVSTKNCPFVMRTQLVALEKGLELKTTYIDLQNKPQWFLDISPTGTVPLMKINDQIIFESAVICDLIDELTPGTLYPEDLIRKHQNKSWIEIASNLINRQYAVAGARTEEHYEKASLKMEQMLDIIEINIDSAPFWNGESFSIIDAAFAPVFYRFKLAREHMGIDFLENYPNTFLWSKAVLANQNVNKLFNDEFDRIYFYSLDQNGSYILHRQPDSNLIYI